MGLANMRIPVAHYTWFQTDTVLFCGETRGFRREMQVGVVKSY